MKCVQVEDHICLTGGEDGNIRLWDLRRVDEDDWENEGEMVQLSDVAEEDENRTEDGSVTQESNGIRSSPSEGERDGACARLLEGHTKAVTALYFEDDCLVSSELGLAQQSSDCNHKTPGHRGIRQDTPPVGLDDRSMRHDHGHPLGHLSPINCRHARWYDTPQYVLRGCRLRRYICSTDSTICRW